jgi:geranylgeranyl reductase family protein
MFLTEPALVVVQFEFVGGIVKLTHTAIIGGGPAGAMAAELIARSGRRVTVFEEKLGWEKPCGGGVTHKALECYPFLLPATGEAKPIQEVEFLAGNNASLRFQLCQPLAIYSRCNLNGLLLRRAQSAGAEVLEDRVRDFRRSGSGWELQGRKGNYRADYIVVAAGARTRLRSLLTEDFGPRDFMLTFGYYVPSRDDLLRVQFFEKFEGYAWSFPRPDHLSVGICGKVGEDSMADLRERLHGFMRRCGYSFERANVYSHLLPALSVDTWSGLRLVGPGWALAGDAAGLVDPVTGEGIYYAMRSGELLAASLLEGLPELYPVRVQEEFGKALALGARLARTFYYGEFLGVAVSTRLVEFGAGSRRFLGVIQDMLEGSQSYLGLAAKLHFGLAAALWDIGIDPLRQMLRVVRDRPGDEIRSSWKKSHAHQIP